ncbi:tripartite tricarboxylate transporter substrate binding protein [Azohydromonas sediminis]|uniref:tripartite tricarboxylate transporter substrate binding protein n=1 Tax=Azohydromonas sediminis TaxID=2259674 RepID=UPI000E647B81|nr:tripartite tricarboxylate transporter substrate binding protein [Azohydromonas sediminis]
MHPTLTRRLATLGLCAAALAAALPAIAQEWPARPVKLIVPFAPGGSADVFGRFLAQRLQEALGQSFVVENRPGGGAVIGTDAVAKSAPDGYTLLVMSNTLPELIKAAKDKPDGMTYASSGPGTPYHFAGELFKHMAGIQIVHVPYKGSSGARTDVLGGQVDMMFDAIPTMTEHIKSGKVKALAVSGRARSPILPDTPTLAEAGVPGYEATIWLGVMAPRGTPAAVVNRLNAEIGKITANADVRRAWAAQGTSAMTMSVDEFTRYLNDDIAKWANLIRAAHIKVD